MNCSSCSMGCEDPQLLHRTDFNSENLETWCTNCGNYGIKGGLKNALALENIKPHEILLVFDIGCNSNGADKINGYRFKGLHGRAIPFACGASIANNNVPVMAFAGDGATMGEGVNHLVHAVRTNYNVTFVLHNNHNYGLTTGQASPTTPNGVPMKANPYGATGEQINVAQFILSLNPSFYARSFSGNVGQVTDVIRAGLNHKGFSVVEILQACPTFNKATPHQWYIDRVFDVNQDENYDRTNLEAAQKISKDLTENIATGVLYQNKDMPDFYNKLEQRNGVETELVQEVEC